MDCRDVVRNAVSQAKSALCEGVRLTIRLWPAPRVIGDSACILQALYVLVDAACMVTQSGTIAVGAGYWSSGDKLFLFVRDGGGGITQSLAEAMFGEAGDGPWGMRLVHDVVAAHKCVAC